MATKKEIRGVIVPRHDTAINWSKAVNFTPENGELIIISADNATDVARGYYLDSEGNKLTSITVNSNGVNKVCAIKPSDKVRFKFGNGVDNVNVLPFAAAQADIVDQTYSPNSENAQSGKAVKEALNTAAAIIPGEGTNSIKQNYPENISYGDRAVSIGPGVRTYGENSVGIGCGSNIYNQDGVSLGRENRNYSHVGITAGYENIAGLPEYADKQWGDDIARGAIAIGWENHATHAYSCVLGDHNNSSRDNQVVFGRFCADDPNALFILGNGIDLDKRSNLYTVDREGNACFTGGVYVGSSKKDGAGSKKLTTNLIDGSSIGSIRTIGSKEEDSSYKLGQYSVAEGYGTKASGDYSHAEGYYTEASGAYSHAEGFYTKASGNYSHAEGYCTEASGGDSNAEGFYTKASGNYSHAEGWGTIASGEGSHAEGKYNISNTTYADVIGNGTSDTKRSNAYVMDWNGNAWFAGDVYTKSTSGKNKDEGSKKLATEEYVNTKLTTNLIDGSSIGSIRTIGSKEEDSSYILGQYGVAEGYATKASGNYSHAEGNNTNASGYNSHAEGIVTTASGYSSHAEGYYTTASGDYSHAEGWLTIVSGDGSHAEGGWTIASGVYSHAQGMFNISNTTYADVIGNGTSDTERSNAYTMDWKGNAWFAGAVTSNGADYAEFFEWLDGNPNNEDRVGYLVALDGEKIRFANPGDEILGIISANPAILGDNYECNWNGKYLTDEFGRILYDKVEEFIDITKINEETGETIIEKKSLGFFDHPRINPNYNPEQEYINRRDRSEWAMVGMFGKLLVLDDGTAQLNGYVSIGEGGIATASTEKTNMRVLSRVNDHIIKVLLK